MEITHAPFFHEPTALLKAIREHLRLDWRDWIDTARPELLRIWWLDPPIFILSGRAFGAGHLGMQSWIEQGHGIHIREEVSRRLADELRRQLGQKPAYGYVYLEPIGLMAACIMETPPWLAPFIAGLKAGHNHFFMPCTLIWQEELQSTRLLPYLPPIDGEDP